MNSKTLKGEWWAPSNPEKRVAGIVQYIPSGSHAELFGILGDDDESDKNLFQSSVEDLHHGIIHGETTDAEFVTIVDAVADERNNPDILSDQGISSTKYQFSRIYIGDNFECEPKFSQYTLSFDGLVEWFEPSRIEMKNPSNVDNTEDIIGKYLLKKSRTLEINLESAKLEFVFSHGSSTSLQQTKLTEGVSISIKLDEPMKYPCFNSEYLRPIQRYIALATGAPIQPNSITGIKSSNPPGIDILTKIPDFAPENRSVSPVSVSFKPDDVDLEESLQSWFKNESTAEYMFNSYFGTIYNTQQYLEHEFLSLAVALESYFDHIYPDYKEMDSTEYKSIRDDLIDQIPDDAGAKKRIKDLLQNIGNLPSFKDQLKLVVEDFEQVIEIFINLKDTLTQVRDIRHDLAHGLGRDYTNEELAVARYRLQLILECILLDIAGIDNESKVKILIQKYEDADFVDLDRGENHNNNI